MFTLGCRKILWQSSEQKDRIYDVHNNGHDGVENKVLHLYVVWHQSAQGTRSDYPKDLSTLSRISSHLADMSHHITLYRGRYLQPKCLSKNVVVFFFL